MNADIFFEMFILIFSRHLETFVRSGGPASAHRAGRADEGSDNGRDFPDQGRALRLKKCSDEKRMPLQFHGPHLASTILRTNAEGAGDNRG
jgi:hypothetical protein